MKTLLALSLAIMIAGPLSAQEADPLPDTPVQPAQDDSHLGEPSLIPQAPPPMSRPPGMGADPQLSEPQQQFLKSRTGASVSEFEQRVKFRRAKTAAVQDGKLFEMLDAAEAEKTDVGKRARLRDYYNALFDRIIRIDGSLKEYADLKRQEALGRLTQERLRPLGSDLAIHGATE